MGVLPSDVTVSHDGNMFPDDLALMDEDLVDMNFMDPIWDPIWQFPVVCGSDSIASNARKTNYIRMHHRVRVI